jgi:hypothetical protein
MAEVQKKTEHKQPPPQQRAEPDAWQPMSSAPKDGTFLLFKGDHRNDSDVMSNEWYWYKTRKLQMGTWIPCGWWRRRFGPNVPPSFDPLGWRYAKDGYPE